MGQFKGFHKVFSFTFGQQVRGKNFRITLVVIAFLCLLLPPLIMGLVEKSSGQGGGTPGATESTSAITNVMVVDMDTAAPADYAVLNQTEDNVYNHINYVPADSVETAKQQIADENSLILQVEYTKEGYDVNVLTPENCGLSEEDKTGYETFLDTYFSRILQAKSGMTEEQFAAMDRSVGMELHSKNQEEAKTDAFASIRKVLSFVLPYLTIMVLYFMILAYGQGIANNVIQEKASKLMDNMLVSVKPGALIMGKVLALFTSGVLQTVIWILCIIGGMALGVQVVYWINPASNMLFVQFIHSLGMFSGVFNLVGIIFALLIFLAGFLLYCALASMGGSLASKQEELGSTNMLFTMALIFSFMVAMFGGALEGSVPTWMLYVPFTAVMVAPGQALLGEMTLAQECISLGILVVSAVVIVWLAGKIYRMMAFYKGNPPSIGKLFTMMKNREAK